MSMKGKKKSKLSLSKSKRDDDDKVQTISDMFRKQKTENVKKLSKFSAALDANEDDDVICVEDEDECVSPYFKKKTISKDEEGTSSSKLTTKKVMSLEKRLQMDSNKSASSVAYSESDRKTIPSISGVKKDVTVSDDFEASEKLSDSVVTASAERKSNKMRLSLGKRNRETDSEEFFPSSVKLVKNNDGQTASTTEKSVIIDEGKEKFVEYNSVNIDPVSVQTLSSQCSKSSNENSKVSSPMASHDESVSVDNAKGSAPVDDAKRSALLSKSNNDERKEEREEGEEDSTKEMSYRLPYYLENFETILKSVMEDDSNYDLFNKEDKETIESYHCLSEAAKKLYIRMFSRKLNWIPLSKLKYPEIAEDLTSSLKELAAVKFIDSDENLTDLGDLLHALSAGDIKSLAKSYHVASTVTQKGQQVQELIKKSQQSTISSMFGAKKGGVADAMMKKAKQFISGIYRLRSEVRAVFMRTMMLYSLLDTSGDEENGSGGQGQLFHMLMVNMGKMVYPSYVVKKDHRIFSGREDVIRFEQALQLESDLMNCTMSGKWADAYSVYQKVVLMWKELESDESIVQWNENLPDFLRPFSATSVIYRLLNTGIDILQRRKEFPEAVELLRKLLSQTTFCCAYRGYWWERLALNLDAHLKQPLESLEAIAEGLADSYVKVGHRLAIYQRAEAICQRAKLKVKDRLQEFHHEPVAEMPKVYLEGRVVHQGISTTGTRFLLGECLAGGDAEDMTVGGVEEFVLDHYSRNGFPSGIHAEGSVISCLFALYFWDILFCEVPDAFHSPFQAQPLDFYTLGFYTRRKEAIDERLSTLENSSIEELHKTVEDAWAEHEGVLCTGMNWEKWRSVDFVKSLVSCMGGKVLSGITGRFARCTRHTRSGFPDLTLWNVDTGALKICEVKGPGDRLSHKQILWIDHLLELGVDAEVCHVKAVAAKKLKPV
ncbi:fanconi-associated nuclease 1 [Aplysia californica]|uniref:Fanconi-associated nuclease n=1 Tax=Aplysia californica TaxID=6500 RepID=A0ABM0JI37_APLCA|nr:fanconi-associated nuclease 1 [Aplysia californica]